MQRGRLPNLTARAAAEGGSKTEHGIGAAMTVRQSISVNVRLFSGVQALVGAKNVGLELPDGATVATLRDHLVRAHAVLEGFMTTYVIAVEEEVQDPTHVLHDGDTVDLIPPISGG
jgi:molybdopterin converting factor small subunit